MSDRNPLAQLVEPINAEVARLIRDQATTIQRLDTPFLRHGLIFRIDWYGPHKPVSVTIGGRNAEVLYAGSAPGMVAGLLQINARVPDDLAGGALPVIISIGGRNSQAGVTVSIQK